MKAPRWLSAGAALAWLAAGGCSTGPAAVSAGGRPAIGTRVVAVDVSESAKGEWERLYPRARRLVEETGRGTHLAVFRFDVSIVEVYDGKGVLDGADAGTLLKPLVSHTANTKGTNLAVLVRKIDSRAPHWKSPVELDVVTDCGTELMSAEDRDYVKETVARWEGSKEIVLRFHGVTTGHREALRDMAPSCEIVEQ